jgi:site-specific recombinase XerD
MAKFEYSEMEQKKDILMTRAVTNELPAFCREFFISLNEVTSTKTRLNYAYDLRVFFKYLTEEIDMFDGRKTRDLQVDDLSKVTANDIRLFMDFLTLYIKDDGTDEGEEVTNGERGKARKLAAIRKLFEYFYSNELIPANPAQLVKTPKLHEKAIIRLEPDEAARLLDEIESGENLTAGQKKYHSFTKARDLALVTLLLGTGMRVSECVGIDLDHIDFSLGGIKIHRKGGNEVVIYFGDEVEDALQKYLVAREGMNPLPGHENALFLSIQNKRMSVRSVENLVKKYSKLVTNVKNISPHKLRSTFGTNLYRETGDIYLVADVLGHKDVNTTRRHYAEESDENRRKVRNVKIRRD